MLSVELVRQVPEALKPRQIAIATGTTVAGTARVTRLAEEKAAA